MLKKSCQCGAKYDAVSWSRLPYVGVQPDAEEPLELRLCRCKTTLAVEITMDMVPRALRCATKDPDAALTQLMLERGVA